MELQTVGIIKSKLIQVDLLMFKVEELMDDEFFFKEIKIRSCFEKYLKKPKHVSFIEVCFSYFILKLFKSFKRAETFKLYKQ